MTSDVIVRGAEAGDFDEWLRLWTGYNEFYGRAGESKLPDGITETTWARLLDDREPMYALVAEAEGSLVGVAHYLFHRSTTSIAPACYLQDLFTSPSARRNGVGTALIGAVLGQARAVGSPRVYWLTHEGNETARRLYDKIGERSAFIIYQITA